MKYFVPCDKSANRFELVGNHWANNCQILNIYYSLTQLKKKKFTIFGHARLSTYLERQFTVTVRTIWIFKWY